MRDTSRRSLLAAFSAFPAATVAAALPLPALARPAENRAHADADADLIATARRVLSWAHFDQKTEIHLSEAEDRRDTMQPRRPADITAEVNRIAAGVLDRYPNPLPDDMASAFLIEAQDAARPFHDAHQAAMSAYRAACDHARHVSGHAEAERLSKWVTARLVRGAEALAAMPAQTWAGAVAKAQAYRTIQAADWEHCVVEWRDNLANSIAADVLRIGGQADGSHF